MCVETVKLTVSPASSLFSNICKIKLFQTLQLAKSVNVTVLGYNSGWLTMS